MNKYLLIALLGLISFGISFFLSTFFMPLLIRLAFRLGFLDVPHGRKKHNKPIPNVGGIGIFLSFWITVIVGLGLAFILKDQVLRWFNIAVVIVGMTSVYSKVAGIFLGSLVMISVGFLDDRFNFPPIVKFAGQCAAAFILMSIGFNVNLLSSLGVWGYLITFIWILLIINAFNFIDSVDGHCGGIAFLSLLMFYLLTTLIYQPIIGLFVISLAGAVFGFLRFNRSPAKIFLGDNGSLLIGYLMAAITLLCRYRFSNQGHSYLTTFIPILMFGVPIYDTVSVIVVRILRGIPPWKGDRNHFAHRMIRLGMSLRAAVSFSYFLTIVLGLLAILSTQVLTVFGNILIVMLFVSIIGIIAFLEYYSAVTIRRMERLNEYRTQNKLSIDDLPPSE